MRLRTTLTCLAATGSILGISLAQAEEPAGTMLETITVTANKVEEDITDVPQSITVIDDEVIKEKGIKNVPGIISEIPNMNIQFGDSSNNLVNFRGLNQSLFTSNNPVVIYIDGVAYSNSYGFDVSLQNVERIEVLRGPQGTLYGKDALGAVIKVVTKEPTNEWYGNIGTEYGSYNDIEGSFNVNGPLIRENLYLGINGRYQQDDGWITNKYTGSDEANKSNIYNLGSFLLYKPTDRFSAKFTLSKDSYEDHGPSGYTLSDGADADEFSRDDAENSFSKEKTLSATDSLAQSLHLKYEFDSMTLTSTTTRRDLDSENNAYSISTSGTFSDRPTTFDTTNTETWAEELRLSSNNTDGVRWIAGLYFENEDVEKGPFGIQYSSTGYTFEMNFDSETESKTMAVFGQTMVPLGERFELTIGARYQHIDKEMDLDAYSYPVGGSSDPYYSLQADETWDVFLPKIALSYWLSDKWTSYVSVAQGYMPGGFNYTAYAGTGEDNTFDPQQSTNYEVGIKGHWNRLRLSSAVFYMSIEDIHVYKFYEDTRMVATDNADSAHSLGAELELTYFLNDSLELTAALGIIDTEYDDYDTGTAVFDGESIENTPSHTARVGVAYFHPNGFYARGDVMSIGEVPYYNNAKTQFNEVDSYIKADVKIGYRFKDLDVYAYCNNLTDEEYISYFGASGQTSSATYGDPRTFGVGLRYSF